ncbi:MAG: hypothetical protein J3K34DRAFT_417169 [Monoraphidium minutum]|nr:MAG: hypothetical protein J3K34DRAFT_417169 [Monoraphidium minutum]
MRTPRAVPRSPPPPPLAGGGVGAAEALAGLHLWGRTLLPRIKTWLLTIWSSLRWPHPGDRHRPPASPASTRPGHAPRHVCARPRAPPVRSRGLDSLRPRRHNTRHTERPHCTAPAQLSGRGFSSHAALGSNARTSGAMRRKARMPRHAGVPMSSLSLGRAPTRQARLGSGWV